MIRVIVCESDCSILVQTSHISTALLESPNIGRYIVHESTDDRGEVECDLLYRGNGEEWFT